MPGMAFKAYHFFVEHDQLLSCASHKVIPNCLQCLLSNQINLNQTINQPINQIFGVMHTPWQRQNRRETPQHSHSWYHTSQQASKHACACCPKPMSARPLRPFQLVAGLRIRSKPPGLGTESSHLTACACQNNHLQATRRVRKLPGALMLFMASASMHCTLRMRKHPTLLSQTHSRHNMTFN